MTLPRPPIRRIRPPLLVPTLRHRLPPRRQVRQQAQKQANRQMNQVLDPLQQKKSQLGLAAELGYLFVAHWGFLSGSKPARRNRSQQHHRFKWLPNPGQMHTINLTHLAHQRKFTLLVDPTSTLSFRLRDFAR